MGGVSIAITVFTSLPARPKPACARGRILALRPHPLRRAHAGAWRMALRYGPGMRPGTTIAIVALLGLILAAAFAQFVLKL